MSALAASLLLLVIDIVSAADPDRDLDSAKHRMLAAVILTFVAFAAKAS